jgi:Flp pilus assembly protein TadD
MPYIEAAELFPLALRFADLSLGLDPDEPMGYAQRGLVLRRMNRLPEAEKDYRAAIDAGAVSAHLHNNLGTLLLDTGRPEEAQESFRRALELAPDNPTIRLNFSRAQAASEPSKDL